MKRILLCTFMALQVADALTTEQVIARGGWEASPVEVWAMNHFGVWWPVPKLVLMLACTLVMCRWPVRYVLLSVALMGVVVINNVMQ
jgi:hypothetical protein